MSKNIQVESTKNNVTLPANIEADIIARTTNPKTLGVTIRHNGSRTTSYYNKFTPHSFSIIVREDTDFTYDSKKFNFIATRNGWYKVHSQITSTLMRGSKQHVQHGLFLNDKLVDGSLSYSYHKRSEHKKLSGNTAIVQFIVPLVIGDYIDVRSKATNKYGMRNIANATNILIERV